MPKIDYSMFVRIVAVVFSVSAVTAFTFAILRLLYPALFYMQDISGTILVLHYFLCGLMTVTSAVGFVNSGAVMFGAGAGAGAGAGEDAGRRITRWLLLDSLFETARVLHLFMSEVLLRSDGPAQVYDMIIGGAQYLIDSLLYCQVILKKQ